MLRQGRDLLSTEVMKEEFFFCRRGEAEEKRQVTWKKYKEEMKKKFSGLKPGFRILDS